jgi:hypothetical protein
MDYRLFISYEVLAQLETFRRSRKAVLLRQFERIRNFPGHYSEFSEADEAGRRVDVSIFDGLAIYYWIDEADKDVKILKLMTAD